MYVNGKPLPALEVIGTAIWTLRLPRFTASTPLLETVLKGDAASFEPLVEKYSPRVFSTARRYARRESEVEDIAQEVWLKAFQKLGSFRGDAPFEHWLMRLTVRTCYDFLRAHRRNRRVQRLDAHDRAHRRRSRAMTSDSRGPRPNADAAGARPSPTPSVCCSRSW